MSQKQALLNQLSGYLSGSDNVKKVMNSPTLDHHGKMLSYDGTKVFNTNGRGRNGRGRGGSNRGNRGDRKRGNDNQSNQSSGGDRGKSKKPVIYTSIISLSRVVF